MNNSFALHYLSWKKIIWSHLISVYRKAFLPWLLWNMIVGFSVHFLNFLFLFGIIKNPHYEKHTTKCTNISSGFGVLFIQWFWNRRVEAIYLMIFSAIKKQDYWLLFFMIMLSNILMRIGLTSHIIHLVFEV